MRYLRWSYPDLLACPVDYLEVIAEEAKKEAAEARARNRQRGKR